MIFEKKSYPVKELVIAWGNGSMLLNSEYQRGEAWSLPQKQALVDSLFRTYPIPPLFLERKQSAGLGGGVTEKFEVIDGQQRLIAISEFFADNFPLLSPADKKLRLPVSLRSRPALWAEKHYTALDLEQRERLDNTKIDVYLISEVDHPDEVRDLFIRLQSGTALTRQQIRDAWPGNLGPFVVSLAGKRAGKIHKHPRFEFFQLVDGRGRRREGDEMTDPYAKHRLTCAQLLRILFGRMTEIGHFPKTSAADLDGLYHEYTDIDLQGETIGRVLKVFDHVEDVFTQIGRIYVRKYKVHKQGMFALCLFFQDALRNPQFKMDHASINNLAKYVTVGAPKATGRSSSAANNSAYYDLWREHLPENIGVKMDAKRAFDDQQKRTLYEAAGRKCVMCGDDTEFEDGEGDHYPIPHRDGGPTVIENGRFVCKACHPRGRPKLPDVAVP